MVKSKLPHVAVESRKCTPAPYHISDIKLMMKHVQARPITKHMVSSDPKQSFTPIRRLHKPEVLLFHPLSISRPCRLNTPQQMIALDTLRLLTFCPVQHLLPKSVLSAFFAMMAIGVVSLVTVVALFSPVVTHRARSNTDTVFCGRWGLVRWDELRLYENDGRYCAGQ